MTRFMAMIDDAGTTGCIAFLAVRGGMGTKRIIIHVDMDAFYASVEIRDDPSLRGKPVIIGSQPHERGVVSTCSYEARQFGVHSGMNIKDAYRLCPNGVFIRPNFQKYKMVSEQLHAIWDSYATASENIALDESYLDVTQTAVTVEKAREFAHAIKQRTRDELGLTCSVGLAYSKTAAKTASEEKKPDGYYEILTPEDFVDLVLDRDVDVLYTVGKKTGEKLHGIGIDTVRDLLERGDEVVELLGSHGQLLMEIAQGIDDSEVVPYRPQDAKSISREITFQEDVYDYELLKDVLLILAQCVVARSRRYGLYGTGVSLKITYSDMKGITRSRSTFSCDNAISIHREAVVMLMALKRRPVRLIGVGIFNLSEKKIRQTTLDEVLEVETGEQTKALNEALLALKARYRIDFPALLPKMCNSEELHKAIENMRIRRMGMM